ncbi:MAG: adenosylhomocysteinase [Candidatus Methanomethylophilaceae archaeon]|nr:adenosylhomocysteinase [Candidatus Methanomethylophilaceae archaeon]
MDKELLEKGLLRLQWAEAHMHVLRNIRERMKKERPLEGVRIGMALHTEAKTGMLAITLKDAGAEIRLASCNPLSTDDSVALALRKNYGLEVYAKKGETQEEYYENLNKVIDFHPDFVIDDGADLIVELHSRRRDALGNVKGANEETTTGVMRLRSMAEGGRLEFPVMAVNDAKMKFLFDNRYGTGQSALDGWMTATNLLIAGKRVVVAGYGWCGKGVASRAKGMGASVIVTEVDPIRAIEAKMDGFEVMPMAEAVKAADIVFTVTGCKDIVGPEHIALMKDGCVLGNSGHFDNEIDRRYLEEVAVSRRKVRDAVTEYLLGDGRKIYLIAEGRLMNLAAGQGHPVEIMDMSFAIQALCTEHLVKNHTSMLNGVHPVPKEIDEMVARLKLQSMGVSIDKLTEEQRRYLEGWEQGT